jgi:hypothetical protein
VIDYAAGHGYYTEDFPPFTSPANTVKIASQAQKNPPTVLVAKEFGMPGKMMETLVGQAGGL